MTNWIDTREVYTDDYEDLEGLDYYIDDRLIASAKACSSNGDTNNGWALSLLTVDSVFIPGDRTIVMSYLLRLVNQITGIEFRG